MRPRWHENKKRRCSMGAKRLLALPGRTCAAPGSRPAAAGCAAPQLPPPAAWPAPAASPPTAAPPAPPSMGPAQRRRCRCLGEGRRPLLASRRCPPPVQQQHRCGLLRDSAAKGETCCKPSETVAHTRAGCKPPQAHFNDPPATIAPACRRRSLQLPPCRCRCCYTCTAQVQHAARPLEQAPVCSDGS